MDRSDSHDDWKEEKKIKERKIDLSLNERYYCDLNIGLYIINCELAMNRIMNLALFILWRTCINYQPNGKRYFDLF